MTNWLDDDAKVDENDYNKICPPKHKTRKDLEDEKQKLDYYYSLE